MSGEQARANDLTAVPAVFAKDPIVVTAYQQWIEGSSCDEARTELHLEFVASLVLHLHLANRVDLLTIAPLRAPSVSSEQPSKPQPLNVGAPSDWTPPVTTESSSEPPDTVLSHEVLPAISGSEWRVGLNSELTAFLEYAGQLPELDQIARPPACKAPQAIKAAQDRRSRPDGKRTALIGVHAYLDRVEERWFGSQERQAA